MPEGEAADNQFLVLPGLNPGCGLALTVFGVLPVLACCGPCVDLAHLRAGHDEEDRNSSGASLGQEPGQPWTVFGPYRLQTLSPPMMRRRSSRSRLSF
jgi:hypothetical protein